MGKRYIIDYCISRWKRESKDEAYQGYIAEVLRLLGENAAVLAHGSYIQSKWTDLIKENKQDNRSADEIAEDIIRRAGLSIGGEPEEE